ncbi:ATP synthase F0 subcomplex A subunit [Amphiplicatus metriothermophilus]|uniref:ATP synthase subunit a n=1 Tax=Amphiplicatus metriothermophilus TaxID=1519374 RepID=A0A239PWX9_9PROT|nr:F0F1 ATP synthase subunit A [Amphiplicatus metriothermophilus]MBB5518952.1 F-type H+-transporting ATPase subunit a [Amphiplicatus metriothermophilus]SNT74533.1 ATP synthase F0 subcomplex A subunit [Amphiplicatus metriothermophilus]
MIGLNAAGPMEQFEIVPLVPLSLGTIDISLTNSALWMIIAVAVSAAFFLAAIRRRALVPGPLQSTAEVAYEFVADMVRGAIGQEGMKFFPYVFTLFIFILTANLLGLFPTIPGAPHGLHTFTTTSHIIVTFALAILSISIVIVYGFYKNGLGFLKLFAPSGVPIWLLPLIVLIEFVSFLSRPLSLSIRLFANMLAGHVILKVFATFIVMLFGAGATFGWLSIFPFLGIVAVTLLELLVAFLQAYVFAILTCIYLNDAVHAGHH